MAALMLLGVGVELLRRIAQTLAGHKFRRRTGTVMGTLEERYLREDLPCGSELCTACPATAIPLTAHLGHYLVPAADALAQFVEVRVWTGPSPGPCRPEGRYELSQFGPNKGPQPTTQIQ